MEIILGKKAGFCPGVSRVVKIASKEAEKENHNLYCLGELVHNEQVIQNLKNKGVKFVDNIEEAKGKTLIRAHGVKKSIYEKAKDKNIEIEDLTCIKVIKTHDIAEEYASKGYYIIYTGKKEHPEAIATLSFCGDMYALVEKEEDLEEVIKDIYSKNTKDILLISQTTYNSELFDKISGFLEERLDKEHNLKIIKTICMATEERQKETKEIAKKVDLMIIIGGKNSSNTNKLYDIACAYCENVLFIQTFNQISEKQIKGNEKIGIMAGASTPEETINEVIEYIKNVSK